tara:strand:+ start:56 stop:634 length:579 start_codon:yes stop_codon:yes gene_type:complete
MSKLIGFMGKKQSGKDTCGDYLIENYNFIKYSFADPIKDIVKILFNFSDQQLENQKYKESIDSRWNITPRETLQKIGTEFGQDYIYKLFPNLETQNKVLWVVLFEIWYSKNKDKNIVITDVRFPHEVECIKKLGGNIIKVNRENNLENNDSHISENLIENVSNDKIYKTIDNNYTIYDLYSQIDTLINLLNL